MVTSFYPELYEIRSWLKHLFVLLDSYAVFTDCIYNS